MKWQVKIDINWIILILNLYLKTEKGGVTTKGKDSGKVVPASSSSSSSGTGGAKGKGRNGK